MAHHTIYISHDHHLHRSPFGSPRLPSELALRRQCVMAPLCGTEGSSMNNSPRSSEWHFAFPQYYSVYTPNMAG